jgi:LysM repeat protein
MKHQALLAATSGLIAFGVVACGTSPNVVQVTSTPQPTVIATVVPTSTLAPTPTSESENNISSLQVETPTVTSTAAPPTETPTITLTPGPYEHTIREGDSLITIVQEYGYTDFRVGAGAIIDQVVQLNDLFSADLLPAPGSIILVPRQTSTPTPGNAATEAVVQATNTASGPVVALPGNGGTTEYEVREGDTIIAIAADFGVTLEQIAVLNQDLNFFTCNFEIPSGGPNCNVPLRVGQVVMLPAPTPTPTFSPTPSGSETPTSTPTYAAPTLLFPPDGVTASAGVFSLQWVSVGILNTNEYYLVEVTNASTGQMVLQVVTRNTSYLLPDSLVPTGGQTENFQWSISLVRINEQGIYSRIGGTPQSRTFGWASR